MVTTAPPLGGTEGDNAPASDQSKKRGKIQLKSVAKRDLPIKKYVKKSNKKYKPSVTQIREEKYYRQQQGVIVSRARMKSYTKACNEAMRNSKFAPLFRMLELENAPKIQQTKEAIDMDTRYINDLAHRLLFQTKLLCTNNRTGQRHTCTKDHVELAWKLLKK